MAEQNQYVDLNFNNQEIQEVVVSNLPLAPTSPNTGQLYYDTTDNRLKYWDGTIWRTTGLYQGYFQCGLGATSNINELTPTTLNLGSIEFDSIGLTVGATEISGFSVGKYKVTLVIGIVSVGSFQDRYNVELQIRINSSIVLAKYGSNYIRRSSGHNESGDVISGFIDITNTTDTLSFSTLREAGENNNDLLPANSWVIIEKVIG